MTGVQLFDGDLVVFIHNLIGGDGIYVIAVDGELLVYIPKFLTKNSSFLTTFLSKNDNFFVFYHAVLSNIVFYKHSINAK